MLIAELLRGVAPIAWAPDEGGAGDGAGTDTQVAEKVTAETGGEVATKGAEAAGGDADDGGAATKAGIGSNSGKTADEVLAELALNDEMKGKLVSSLPKDAQERASKWLKTRASLPDLLKAGLGADSKISELTAQLKGTVRLPGKDAKPEEIAAYRKAVGVPESADKYAVYRPEGYEPTEVDQEVEKTFLESVHAAGLSQPQVDAVLKTHYLIQAQQQKAMETRAREAGERAEEELRIEYGRDYKANLNLANRYIAEMFGPDMGEDAASAHGFLGRRFADGSCLGEDVGFVKGLVRLAKAWADDGAVLMGDLDGATDVDTEIKTMMGKMGTEEYKSKAFQDKLDGLIAIQQKRQSNGAAR